MTYYKETLPNLRKKDLQTKDWGWDSNIMKKRDNSNWKLLKMYLLSVKLLNLVMDHLKLPKLWNCWMKLRIQTKTYSHHQIKTNFHQWIPAIKAGNFLIVRLILKVVDFHSLVDPNWNATQALITKKLFHPTHQWNHSES